MFHRHLRCLQSTRLKPAATFFCASRLAGGCAEAAYQAGEVGAIAFAYGGELHADAATVGYVAHHRLDPDLAFLDEEVDLGGCTDWRGLGGLDEESTEAHVADSGRIDVPMTLPVDPDAFGNLDTWSEPSGRENGRLV